MQIVLFANRITRFFQATSDGFGSQLKLGEDLKQRSSVLQIYTPGVSGGRSSFMATV